MKKRIFSAVLCAVMMGTLLSGCKTSGEEGDKTAAEPKEEAQEEKAEGGQESVLEKDTVRLGSGTGVHILNAIAEEQGYLKDEGLTVEMVICESTDAAFTALSTGKVDVLSTYGTSFPLQYVGSGTDLTMFAGYMIEGCVPIIARTGTEWNGVEDLVGKKIASNPSEFAISGALLDLGYEPLEDVEWVTNLDNHADRIEAVRSGEVDYASLGTTQNYNVEQTEDIETVAYFSDITPNYSCCRVEGMTEFVNDNPNTVKALLRAWMRALEYYQDHKDEAIVTTAKASDLPEEVVACYVNNEHYNMNLDPFQKSIQRAWRYLGAIDFLSDEAEEIDINDHINTSLYKEALDECVEKYGKEDPEFYDEQMKIFEENND